MKTIVVISDSHGNLPKDEEFLQILNESDYIFHLGDGARDIQYLNEHYPDKFTYVFGNCDSFSGELFKIVEVEGVKFLLTHGHKFHVKSDLFELAFECSYQNANYALYGHTHISAVDNLNGVTLINPGSIGYERSYCYLIVNNKNVVHKIVQR